MGLKPAIRAAILIIGCAASLHAAERDVVFLTAKLPNRPVYRGEMFHIDMQVHFPGQHMRRIDINELRNHPPRARTEGIRFLLNRPYFMPTREQINGRQYPVFHYKRSAVATRAGELELVFNTELMVEDFTAVTPRKAKYELATKALTLKVMPLPVEGRPASFTGAVGQFEMIVQADKERVRVNNPVELSVVLRGQGALDTVPMPVPDGAWEGFRVDPLTPRLRTGTVNLSTMTVYSTKEFRSQLLPRLPGRMDIPPLRFSFFNPQTRQYVEQVSKPLPLLAHGEVPAEVDVPEAAANMTASEPEPEKTFAQWKQPGTLAAPSAPLLSQPWFLAAQTAPLFAWLVALTWRKRRDYYDARPRLVRRLRVEKLLRRGEARLEKLAQGGAPGEFYGEAAKLLRERIGERIDIPAGGITEAVMRAELDTCLPAEPAADLETFFAEANAVRFGAGEPPALQTAMDQLRGILAALEKLEAPVDEI
jgi:hypothetical protein